MTDRKMIYLDDAIDALDKLDVNDGVGISSVACYLQEEAIRSIENLPSVQPQKKRGTWIKENIVLTSYPPQFQWYCSECGKAIHGYSAEILTNFCPSCGADMRGTE